MTIIDISRHQGLIDWPRVRHEGGVTYAIIRATLGAAGRDDRYAANWRESGWAGIPRRGAYHYQVTEASGPSQLENILRVTGGDFGNAPFVVDVERTAAERQAMAAGWLFPIARYTEQLRVVCFGLRERGMAVHIYSNYWEWRTITTQPAWAAEFGFHVAAYPFDPDDSTYRPRVPAPWVDWATWQYSSTGRVAGIAGNVDLNRERVPAPPPVPAPVPVPDHLAAVRGHLAAALKELG